MNRIYQSIMNSQTGIRGTLFKKAVERKIEAVKRDWVLEDPILDWVLVDRVRAMLGGRVEFMMVGAAPIAPEVLGFFRTVFRSECIEAYGSSELTGGGTTTSTGDYAIGSVGGPSTALEIRLRDVPEMNYFVTDKPFPRGEICTRGNSRMTSYFKEPAKTAESIDEDGFVLTADIGHIDDRGRLWVLDRKKHLFKLSQGEYVAPEKVESVYLRNLFIAQIYVWGEMTENELVAVVIPDFDLAKSTLGLSGTPAEMVKDPKLKQRIGQELEKTAEQYGLRGFERVKEFHLESEMWTLESGLLTPTLKMKRTEMGVGCLEAGFGDEREPTDTFLAYTNSNTTRKRAFGSSFTSRSTRGPRPSFDRRLVDAISAATTGFGAANSAAFGTTNVDSLASLGAIDWVQNGEVAFPCFTLCACFRAPISLVLPL